MKQPTTLAHRAQIFDASTSDTGILQRCFEGVAERALRRSLARIEHGSIALVDRGRREVYGRVTERCKLACTVHVRAASFHADVAFGGSVGAGESFMAGEWTCDDLTALSRILLVNREALEQLDGGLSKISDAMRRLLHGLARNTRAGSRRNIAAHYDIGNDFFELMLDPTMMYSCAVYENTGVTLEQAQVAKLDRLCRKLDLKPGDHLLEIGTGWGALAIHAARHYGCRVTTTTISKQQHAVARQRIDDAGLSDRISLRQNDYRDLEGSYDKLVSVEMVEAVGHHYLDTFFQRCATLMKPGATMVLQAITIDERFYASARDSVDFIKRHIFPGSCLPSVGTLTASAARARTLRIVDVEDIGPHYAPTLAAWRANLVASADAIRARGYPDALLRMFDFYLCYCEAGFQERTLGDVHMVLQDTRRPVLPTARV